MKEVDGKGDDEEDERQNETDEKKTQRAAVLRVVGPLFFATAPTLLAKVQHALQQWGEAGECRRNAASGLGLEEEAAAAAAAAAVVVVDLRRAEVLDGSGVEAVKRLSTSRGVELAGVDKVTQKQVCVALLKDGAVVAL